MWGTFLKLMEGCPGLGEKPKDCTGTGSTFLEGAPGVPGAGLRGGGMGPSLADSWPGEQPGAEGLPRRWSSDETPKALSWDSKDALQTTQTSQPPILPSPCTIFMFSLQHSIKNKQAFTGNLSIHVKPRKTTDERKRGQRVQLAGSPPWVPPWGVHPGCAQELKNGDNFGREREAIK